MLLSIRVAVVTTQARRDMTHGFADALVSPMRGCMSLDDLTT
jgi:hypothetical protein